MSSRPVHIESGLDGATLRFTLDRRRHPPGPSEEQGFILLLAAPLLLGLAGVILALFGDAAFAWGMIALLSVPALLWLRQHLKAPPLPNEQIRITVDPRGVHRGSTRVRIRIVESNKIRIDGRIYRLESPMSAAELQTVRTVLDRPLRGSTREVPKTLRERPESK